MYFKISVNDFRYDIYGLMSSNENSLLTMIKIRVIKQTRTTEVIIFI